VQIDVDAKNVSMRYPSDINLIGDAKETLLALLPLLEQHTDGDWRSRIERDKESWHETDMARAADSATPMNPQRVFTELDARIPANAIVSADAGTTANWSARGITMRPGMKYSLSGGLASMGSAVPYAIAAKLAFPDRVAIALAGDGAMQMNGSAELLTIAKYWKRWSDPRLVVMVLNNHDLNQVTWEQRIESGDPKYSASQDLPDMRYADYAISIGLSGIRVDDPAQMGAAWDMAFAADRPFVIDAVTDPNVPFFPPFITFEQAKNMTSAIVKGDTDDANIIVASAKSLLAELLHH
jgi:pyruvate dehydrogenase (quinone)